MSVKELKSAISQAASNLESQINELNSFLKNNDDLMQQISQELEGSSNAAAAGMKQALTNAKEQVSGTIGLVETAKNKLARYGQSL